MLVANHEGCKEHLGIYFNSEVHIGEDKQLIPPNESAYICLEVYLPESIIQQHGLPFNSDALSVFPYRKTSTALLIET